MHALAIQTTLFSFAFLNFHQFFSISLYFHLWPSAEYVSGIIRGGYEGKQNGWRRAKHALLPCGESEPRLRWAANPWSRESLATVRCLPKPLLRILLVKSSYRMGLPGCTAQKLVCAFLNIPGRSLFQRPFTFIISVVFPRNRYSSMEPI